MARAISNKTRLDLPYGVDALWRRLVDWGNRLPFAFMGVLANRSTTFVPTAINTFEAIPIDTVIHDTDGFLKGSTTQFTIPRDCGGWYVPTIRARCVPLFSTGRVIVRVEYNDGSGWVTWHQSYLPTIHFETLTGEPHLMKPTDLVRWRFFTNVSGDDLGSDFQVGIYRVALD